MREIDLELEAQRNDNYFYYKFILRNSAGLCMWRQTCELRLIFIGGILSLNFYFNHKTSRRHQDLLP